MKSAERTSATDYVVDTLRVAIQNGDMKAGDRLPKEADLAEKLGVGRSTLREAVKVLNAYGVLESRQGEGTYVVNNSAQKFFEFLFFSPSRENDKHYLELRRAVEVGTISIIYDKVDEETLDKLQVLVDVMRKKHSIDRYVAADVEFHHRLVTYLGNPMLEQLNNMLIHMRRDLLNRLFCYHELIEDAYIEHG